MSKWQQWDDTPDHTRAERLERLRLEREARADAIRAARLERAERVAAALECDENTREGVRVAVLDILEAQDENATVDALWRFSLVTGETFESVLEAAERCGVLEPREGFADDDELLRTLAPDVHPTLERFARVDTPLGVAVRGHRYRAHIVGALETAPLERLEGTARERLEAQRRNRDARGAHTMLCDEAVRRADLILMATADRAHPYASAYNMTGDITTGTALVGTDDYSWHEVRSVPRGGVVDMGASVVGRDSSGKPVRFSGTRVTVTRSRMRDERAGGAVHDDRDARASRLDTPPLETVYGAVWQATAGSRGWRVLKRYGTSARVLRLGTRVRSAYSGTRFVLNGDGTYAQASVLRFVEFPVLGTLRFIGHTATRSSVRTPRKRRASVAAAVATRDELLERLEAAALEAVARGGAPLEAAQVWTLENGARVALIHELAQRRNRSGALVTRERLRVTVSRVDASGARVRTATTVRSAAAAVAAVRNRILD